MSNQTKMEMEYLPNGDVKIVTPFLFGDGDYITLSLTCNDGVWRLTDGGDTLFRNPLPREQSLIEKYLKFYDTREKDGELSKTFDPDEFPSVLFEFIQCLIEIKTIVSTLSNS